MVLIPWWPNWAESAVLYVGAGVAWVMGIYLLLRGGRRRVPLLAALAMLTFVVWLVGQALGMLAPDPASWLRWLRGTWWAAAVAPPLWVALVLTLYRDETPRAEERLLVRLYRPLIGATLVAGLGLALVGTTTNLVHTWDLVENRPDALRFGGRVDLWHAGPGPFYVVFQLFLLVCLLGPALVLAVLWRASPLGTPLRARFGWLLTSGSLFLLGGAYIVIASGLYGASAFPGELSLLAGLGILGWNVARYGALLAGEVLMADFVAFAASLLGIMALYGLALVVLGPRDYVWLERALPLLLIVPATHVLVSARGDLLGPPFYGPIVSTLRARLHQLADEVTRQPDPITALARVREIVDALVREQEKGLPAEVVPVQYARDSADSPETRVSANGAVREGEESLASSADLRLLVEGALRHLNDLPTLSRDPLLSRLTATADSEGTPLERATLLRGALVNAVERLRPPGPRPTPGGSAGPGGWLHYLVLEEAYVEGRPNKQVMQRYLLSEGTFHRARRRAVDALAAELAARELAGAQN